MIGFRCFQVSASALAFGATSVAPFVLFLIYRVPIHVELLKSFAGRTLGALGVAYSTFVELF